MPKSTSELLIAERRTVRRLRAELERVKAVAHLMARLAADTPQFSNPLTVFEAQNVRDRILTNGARYV